MEISLINRLKIERQKAITGSMTRLFDRLLEQLNTNLNNRSNEYQVRRSALEAELMRDFQAFTNEQRQIYQNRITNVVNRTNQRVPDWISSQTSYIYERVKNAISYTNSWDDLKDVLENRLVILLNKGKNEITDSIKDQCNPIQEEVYRISEEFDLSFQQAYQRLNILGGRVNINSFSNITAIKIDAYSVLASAKEINQKNFGNAITAILSHVFKDVLKKRQQQVWNLIKPKLEREFKEIESVAIASIVDYGEQGKQAVNARIAYYLSVYQEQINSLIQSQQWELVELQKFQEQTQSDLLQIKKLQSLINC